MMRYVMVGLISGVLFGVLDGFINANPVAVRLYKVYQPIAKTSVNIEHPVVFPSGRSG